MIEKFEMEVWKQVVGYDGLYEVSNIGRVRSVDANVKTGTGFRIRIGKIRVIGMNELGYCIVLLSKNNKRRALRVHQLVANAFIPNPENLPEINHEDGNKKNNSVSNLKRCTISYNRKHAYIMGLNKGRWGKTFHQG